MKPVHALALLVLLTASAAGAQEAVASKDEAEVLAETKKYVGLLKSAQPAQAMEAYWDFEAMLPAIFGKDLDQHTPAERQEMKDRIIGLVKGAYENPKLVQAMKDAKVQDMKAEKPVEGVTVVRFNVVLGETTVPNVLHFRKTRREGGEAWRVVDGGVNNNLLVPALRRGFAGVRTKLTPLQYVREVAKPPARPPRPK